jgi:hypothetical protein
VRSRSATMNRSFNLLEYIFEWSVKR